VAADPLHVGVDATSWANDRGFGRFTRELITALAARAGGFRYTLVFDQPPDAAVARVPAGVEVVSATTRRTLNQASVGANTRSIPDLWRLGQVARRARFDLFFFPSVYSYFPIFARLPCVVCYHDSTAERLPELLFPTRLNRWLWRAKTMLATLQTTRAMTVSQASADDLERILKISRERIDLVTEAAGPAFRVIDDPAVAAAARARYGVPADAPLLVHVGGMNRHKNQLGLLAAMALGVERRPEVHLALVGDICGGGFWDNVPELQAFVRDHPPLGRNVHFTGYIPDGALTELLNGADALIFPSLSEGFGLPAVEAMCCGLPVLASRRGSLPEVVGDAGRYFDPLDPAAIAACVLEFLADPAARARLGRVARERVGRFTWERAAVLAEESFRRASRSRG
jgi:alpha-1,3-rhamnosyl/mannosyltransferase